MNLKWIMVEKEFFSEAHRQRQSEAERELMNEELYRK